MKSEYAEFAEVALKHMAEADERRVRRDAKQAVEMMRRWTDEHPRESDPPLWITHPPEDQIVVTQVPECDGAGNVTRMGFYNASGERVR